MAWADKIKEYMEKEGFGTYLVEIKDHYFFQLNSDKGLVLVETNNTNAKHSLTERTIAGTYRRQRDLEGDLSLEIFRDFNVLIPYSAIKDLEKIRDSMYPLPKGLEDELRGAADDIDNGLEE